MKDQYINDSLTKKPYNNAQYFIAELVEYFGYTYQEVADILDINLSTILNVRFKRMQNPNHQLFQKITCFYFYQLLYGQATNQALR